ncbi:D-alanyl-lipoteichoic acid acyltransferase DltB, MBOAT superfamily [Roseivivax lentus]|uniref:Probable alginate O-acetylase AlgI n=1 Tax=Roseivivax lentus TaxID=633194 RepID=A0A1N7NYC2_9RHOB|nr:MBOAT family O-acyltransferase [Roseivivax lentus]SIT03365.1 D-alanyl-lipoteichoic acid acyltransferase DltB, MBOAT superfamily [Roseivivax lentus]
MLFTSLEFLLFLPVAVALFWVLPGGLRLHWLMLASLVFYASFGIGNLAYLAAVAGLTLAASAAIRRAQNRRTRRLALSLGLTAVLGLLVFLKFYDPIAAATGALPASGLRNPAGFSFYAFMAASLLIDRYRRPAPGATPYRDGLYLAWFPKILAGPITRAGDFLFEIRRNRRAHAALFVLGAQLILWGLLKKVVVADNLAPFVDRTYAIPAYAVPMELMIASYFFAFQIYCDFSGYTDIARGVSFLFGIRLAENFRRPYFARSVGEFWSERWHITLAHWFRDYLYIPLGGSRVGRPRFYLNIMVVFVISGLWHAGLGYGVGWGFLVWGALNGAYIWGERALAPLGAALRRHAKGWFARAIGRCLAALVVFHLVLISWVFFRAASLSDGWTVLTRIFAALPELPALLLRYPFTAEHAFLACLILGLLVIEFLDERRPLWRRLARMPRPLRWGAVYAGIFALLLLGRWQSEAFVYMQF